MLRGDDLLGAHPGEEIVARVELADVFEAEPQPFARSVEPGRARAGRAELARFVAVRGLALLDAVVVPQSHPVQNQVPFAFYLLRDDATDPGEPTLRQWLRPRLDPGSIPDGFARLDRFPMTDQGKVDRSRLTWIAESGGEAV